MLLRLCTSSCWLAQDCIAQAAENADATACSVRHSGLAVARASARSGGAARLAFGCEQEVTTSHLGMYGPVWDSLG